MNIYSEEIKQACNFFKKQLIQQREDIIHAFFSKLNRGGRIGYQTGGIVGDQQFVPAQGDTQNNNKTETSNNNATSNTTVNITVNSGTGEASVDGGNAGTEDREMATRLRDAVLSVLKQEKRTGGMLRDVTSNDQ